MHLKWIISSLERKVYFKWNILLLNEKLSKSIESLSIPEMKNGGCSEHLQSKAKCFFVHLVNWILCLVSFTYLEHYFADWMSILYIQCYRANNIYLMLRRKLILHFAESKFMKVLCFQMMMHKLSPEEYILATINLYLDILNLFLELLRIFGERKG